MVLDAYGVVIHVEGDCIISGGTIPALVWRLRIQPPLRKKPKRKVENNTTEFLTQYHYIYRWAG